MGTGLCPVQSEQGSAAACGRQQIWVRPRLASNENEERRPTTDNPANPVPNGVRAIAALFALCAIYLGIAGGLMLLRPGTIAMSAGAPLLFGLELSGPYMFLLIAVARLWWLLRCGSSRLLRPRLSHLWQQHARCLQ